MRLSSLARKIKVTPKQLSEYLSEQGIDLSQGANTKLEKETIEQVFDAFMYDESLEEEQTSKSIVINEKDESLEIVIEAKEETEGEEELAPVEEELEEEEVVIEEESEPANETEEAPAEEPEEIIEVIEETPKSYEPIETEDGQLIESYAELAARDASVKVIKAAKATPLQGLTIKGKIELPTPKTKEQKEKEKAEREAANLDPNAIIYTSGPERERRKKSTHKKRQPHKKRKPQVNSVELERRKKAKEEKTKKAIKEQREKEAKKQYYESKVKTHSANSPSKKKKAQQSLDYQQNSSNPIKRFWRWLNT